MGHKLEDDGTPTQENIDRLDEELMNFAKNTQNIFSEEDSTPIKNVGREYDKLKIGMVWGNVFEVRTFIKNYAIINKFEYYQVKNENYRLRYKCGDEKCEWMRYVKRNCDGHTMELKSTSNLTHTCRDKVVDKNKLAHTGWVANEVEQLIRSVRSTRPCDVQKAIWTKYGVNVSYSTAWNAWTICMKRIVGFYDEGYIIMLELTVQVLLANPGIISTCSIDLMTNEWTGTCILYKGSMEGWLNECMPLLRLDGCFLNGKYGGVYLSIIGLDGNKGLFPIAVFFCRSECTETWKKFLEMMEPSLNLHRHRLNFISDRLKGLIEAVSSVFPFVNHKFCFRYMYKNMKKYHRGAYLEKLAWGAAKAWKQTENKEFLDQLKLDDPAAYDRLHREPYERWCRSHFDLSAECEHITNNFSESFNNWINKVRDKPLHKAIEKLNLMLMKLMYDRRLKAREWDQNGLVPRAITHIEKIYCSKYHIVAKYVATYNLPIHAIDDPSEWGQPGYTVLPLPLVRGPGRPKKQRIKDQDEVLGNCRRYGKCGALGHMKKTCKCPSAQPSRTSTRQRNRLDINNSRAEHRRNIGAPPPSNTNWRATATRGRCIIAKTGNNATSNTRRGETSNTWRGAASNIRRGAASNIGRGAALNIGRGAVSNNGKAPFQPPRPAPYAAT
ncbi:hypothetical protein GIB67_029239 [Kingdonia uniflora]|uniref:Transposase n=1 Tax=Kingdonia uniflora TaxID=39325 RepID=A0A7J7N8P9_9MAGN|nr:hypothetical protein GIB67_029239 [Kingdonia uniflora]